MIQQPVVVIDLSAAIYSLLPEMTPYWDSWEARREFYESPGMWMSDRRTCYNKVLKAQLAMLLSGVWLEPYLEVTKPQVIIAIDRKDKNQEYWRHAWLKALELTPIKLKRRKRVFEPGDTVGKLVSQVSPPPIAYKGGRNYAQNGLQRLKETVLDLVKTMPVSRLGLTGYEADDICATVVQCNEMLDPEEQRHIILAVNDSDIIGLVRPNVTWFDLPRKYKPIVRANMQDINWWRVNVKKKLPLDSPPSIWKEKSLEGDVSDNLPPTQLGETLPAIDLLNPPEGRRLWESETIRETVLHILRNPVTINIEVDKARKLIQMASVRPVFDRTQHPITR